MCALRQKKKELTRQRLIEAASAEFAEVGFARANISRISERANYAAGTIYNYFRSKHELFLAVVEHAMELLTEQINIRIAGLEDPVEKTKCTIRACYKFMEGNEALSKVFIREGFAADPQRQQEFLATLACADNIFVGVLEEGKSKGLFCSDLDSAWAAVLVDGMLAYILLVRWALGDTQLTYDQMADLTIKCFIDGILER
jgi:AcrR family transcriptional regulator